MNVVSVYLEKVHLSNPSVNNNDLLYVDIRNSFVSDVIVE